MTRRPRLSELEGIPFASPEAADRLHAAIVALGLGPRLRDFDRATLTAWATYAEVLRDVDALIVELADRVRAHDQAGAQMELFPEARIEGVGRTG